MLSFIEQLQRKPERARKQIALVGSFAITGIIVILWLMSLSAQAPTPERDIAKENADRPLEILGDNVSALVADAKHAFEGITGMFSSDPVETSVPEAATSE